MAAISNITSTESDHQYNCRWYPIYVKDDFSTSNCSLNDTILFRNEDANLHDNIQNWLMFICCICSKYCCRCENAERKSELTKLLFIGNQEPDLWQSGR